MSPSSWRWLQVALMMAALASSCAALAQQPQPQPTVDAEDAAEMSFHHRVRALLIAGKYGELDRMADEFRHEHSRTGAGGDWRLHQFYEALDAPRMSDQDTLDHLAHLRPWVEERPESVTAKLALATSLHRWAWVARGNGPGDKVPQKDAALFLERHQQALQVLEAAEKLPTRDPQLYLEYMAVGVADGWDKQKMRSMMERGLEIEPAYYYLQRSFANYLLPKWYGEPGDSARFAKEAADRLSGELGDQVYYRIACVLISRSNGNFPVKELDWERIQRGEHSIATAFGETGKMRNEMAFFAYKYKDRQVALTELSTIGNNWSTHVFRDKPFFDKVRDWAHGVTQD